MSDAPLVISNLDNVDSLYLNPVFLPLHYLLFHHIHSELIDYIEGGDLLHRQCLAKHVIHHFM